MQTNTNAFMRTSPTNQNVHKRMITNDNEFDRSAIRQSAHDDVVSFSLMCEEAFNPLVTNRFSHSYHLDESNFFFRGPRCKF